MLKVIIEETDSYGFCNKLTVEHNGIIIFEEFDNGEPEDNYFNRDYAWVKSAIEEAYKLGLQDGKRGNE